MKTKLARLVFTTFALGLLLSTASMPWGDKASAAGNTGAVNFWYSLSNGATEISVDMTPNYGEKGYHYYSLSPFFTNQTYGTYAGLQTNGNMGDGIEVGNLFIFSVWNATEAHPKNGSTATPFDGEGVGYSLRLKYNWSVGNTYRVRIYRTSFDTTNNSWKWAASIKNHSTGVVTEIGEILAPQGASNLTNGALFHERYSGDNPQCQNNISNLEQASVKFGNLKSNVDTYIYEEPAPNNIFTNSSCSNLIHYAINDGVAYSGFGISKTDFSTLIPSSPPEPQSDNSTQQTPTNENNDNKYQEDIASTANVTEPEKVKEQTKKEIILEPNSDSSNINQDLNLVNKSSEESIKTEKKFNKFIILGAIFGLIISIVAIVIMQVYINGKTPYKNIIKYVKKKF